jgi:hypothetical protein
MSCKTRDLSSELLGAGYSPLPLKKIIFRVAKSCKILHFQVTNFEAEANAGSNLTGTRLQRDRSRQHA